MNDANHTFSLVKGVGFDKFMQVELSPGKVLREILSITGKRRFDVHYGGALLVAEDIEPDQWRDRCARDLLN